MALKHAKTSAAGASADPAKVGGDDWNADHLIDENGADMAVGTGIPSAPAAGYVRVFGRDVGGRKMASMIGPSGVSTVLQPHIGRNRIYAWLPQGITGTIATIGGTGNLGSPTGRSMSFSTFFTAMRRAGYVTAATANAGTSARGYGLVYGLSSVANTGGFHMVWRFGTCNYAADGRVFLGIGGSNSSYGPVSPSSMLNIVGIGYDPGDTVWHIYHNDGTGVPTKVSTGLACNTENTDVYELALFAPPGAVQVSYLLTRLADDVMFPADGPGTITTDLPSVNLQPHINIANGDSAVVVGIDLMSMYIETDF